jgi:large subunit ribosomal protein L4
MATAKVFSPEGVQKREQALAESLFDAPVRPFRVQQYVKVYLSNQRQGTHSSLTRAEVAGGGVKPWRQKGSGRARAGSNTSPLWTGGGIIFGPKPRDYSKKTPKKMRRSAVKSAFTAKAKENRLLIVEDFKLDKPQTKEVAKLLSSLGIANRKVLLLNEGVDRNLELSCRNLPGVLYKRAALANAYDVLNADYLLLTPQGLQKCEEVFGR